MNNYQLATPYHYGLPSNQHSIQQFNNAEMFTISKNLKLSSFTTQQFKLHDIHSIVKTKPNN